jgi:hypothetical protein
MAEILGDLGLLLERAEKLQETLPVTVDTAIARVKRAGDSAAGDIATAAERLLVAFDQRSAITLEGMRQAAREAQHAAQMVERRATRFALLVGVVGLLAGLIGGLVVAIAISHRVIGG